MVYICSGSVVCTSGLFVLENKVIKTVHNVKTGDMFTVQGVGSAILTKETRAYWFYLFKDRLNKIKKTHFWQGVDCDQINISYANNKKYRRIQKRYRSLDVRQIPEYKIENEIEIFLDFISFPGFVIVGRNSDNKYQIIREVMEKRNLSFYEDVAVSREIEPVIRITGEVC